MDIFQIDGLNAEIGLARINGNMDVYMRTLRIFIRNIPRQIEQMSENIAQGALDDLLINVHGISGSLMNIGETKCSALGRKLEIAAKNGDHELCKQLYPPFYESLKVFRGCLESAIPPAHEIKRQQGDVTLLHAAVDNVKASLAKYRRTRALDFIQDISKYTFGEETDQKLSALVEAIESYDYNLCAELMRGLIEP